MYFQPFHELFPDIAKKETRTLITLGNQPDLPAGEYTLFESYCNEPGCDCRRVFFNVASHRRDKIEAIITYGWENEKFYADWLGRNDSRAIKQLKGPALNIGSPQSELAPALLTEVTRVLQDKNYVDRLKRHYRMFKEAVDKETTKPAPKLSVVREQPKIGRNEPCPCGSGKKYKKCCGR